MASIAILEKNTTSLVLNIVHVVCDGFDDYHFVMEEKPE